MAHEVECEDCNGTGDCPICGGSGMKDIAPIQGLEADTPCDACHRTGDCQTCNGSGSMPAKNEE